MSYFPHDVVTAATRAGRGLLRTPGRIANKVRSAGGLVFVVLLVAFALAMLLGATTLELGPVTSWSWIRKTGTGVVTPASPTATGDPARNG